MSISDVSVLLKLEYINSGVRTKEGNEGSGFLFQMGEDEFDHEGHELSMWPCSGWQRNHRKLFVRRGSLFPIVRGETLLRRMRRGYGRKDDSFMASNSPMISPEEEEGAGRCVRCSQ